MQQNFRLSAERLKTEAGKAAGRKRQALKKTLSVSLQRRASSLPQCAEIFFQGLVQPFMREKLERLQVAGQ